MSSNPQISAPGSSTYDSNTLHVGDGTWDAERDDFLLPPLMGLNFATMQYNGMGNRFRDLPEYHTLIKGHGILAAITFLLIVPSAIFIARFGWANPRAALQFHIWLQILTVFLSTVVLVLGYFAVGPSRSLTNPHHGIGVAIYVLILFQAMYGWLVRKIEKGRVIWRVSIKLMIHQWVGRATALLAVAQIPLGLTLYGSPKPLFIVYALWMFFLVTLWFFLSHHYQGGGGGDGSMTSISDRRTEVTGVTEESHHHHGGGLLKAAAAGGIAAALFSKFRRNKDEKIEEERTDVSDNRYHSHHSHGTSVSGTSYTDYKTDVSHHHEENHTWRNRILTGLGIAAVAGAAKGVFGGRKTKHTEVSGPSSHSDYSASRTDFSRMEEGRAHGPTTPGANRYRRSSEAVSSVAAPPVAYGSPSRTSRMRLRNSGGPLESEDESSYYSPGKEKRKSHTTRNTLATMGLAGFIKHKFSQRKNRKEEERIEEVKEQDRIEEERMHRNEGRRYTGDRRHRRQNSFTESEMSPVSGSTPALSHHNRPGYTTTAAQVAAASNPHLQSGGISIVDDQTDSLHSLPPPPPIGSFHHNSSGSEAYTSDGGTQRYRHHHAGPSGTAAAGGLAAAQHIRRTSVNSPPLSIKMRMRTDNGRQHVTLQRITPSEAAAERQAAGLRGSRPRADSLSSVNNSADERWRRVEALERAQDAEMRASRQSIEQAHNTLPGPPPGPPPLHSSSPAYNESLPPPPPITGSGMYDTGESAAGSRADSNRRRRRAERARADQAGRAGNRVEFS